jgi:hypothetical protein
LSINDILAIPQFLARVACYVFALIVIVRHRHQRKDCLVLASAYLVAGAIALWFLPKLTGAHYDYWDVGFWVNGRLEFPNLDLNFILIHLGFAVCLGWLIAKWITEPAHSLRLLFIPIPVAVVAEVLFRIHKYKGLIFNSDFNIHGLLGELMASLGPALFAGIGIGTAALFIKNRRRHTFSIPPINESAEKSEAE